MSKKKPGSLLEDLSHFLNCSRNNLTNVPALAKGNLTAEANVINVNKVIAFEKPTPLPVYNPIATNSGQISP